MSDVVSRDGTRIAYDKAGSGPAVILIDGAFCSREFGPMNKLAALLAKSCTVITYDRRARGKSGDTAPYAVQREIEDIDALMGAVGGRVALYGVSSGAVLALLAAASLPVSKLAMYEAPFMVGPHARTLPPDRTAVLTRMIAEGHRGDAVKYYMTEVIGLPRFMPFLFQFLPMWRKLKAVARSLPYDSAVMGDFSIPRAEAAAIRVPTLVMAGTRTWPVLLDAAKAAAEAIPHARHETLPGQNHNVAAGAIAPVLEAFIKA
jgi:pimeloyl-ACP methyl ester carboxylesterase